MHRKHGLVYKLMVVFTVAACSSIPLDQPLVGRPQWTVDDRWSMRTIDLWKNEVTESIEQRVASINGDSISLARTTLPAPGGQPGPPSEDRVDGATWTFHTPSIIAGKEVTLAFPLFVGKTWEYQYKTVAPGGSETLQSRSAEVQAWEVAIVPAGTFKALKVVVDGRWRATVGDGVFTGKVNETLWYSPDAKRWVKREWIVRSPEGRIIEQFRSELTRLELQK